MYAFTKKKEKTYASTISLERILSARISDDSPLVIYRYEICLFRLFLMSPNNVISYLILKLKEFMMMRLVEIGFVSSTTTTKIEKFFPLSKL